MNLGKLYLIPNVIASETQSEVIPARVHVVLKTIRYFLAEDARNARRYFSGLKLFDRIEDLQIGTLDKDTQDEELASLMKPLFDGHDMGMVSEAGCPGVADPGALAVQFAHRNKIRVIPLVGPSSILLALMASGLNGQHFAFHGYLPVDAKENAKAIQEFERESRQKNQTQIFIETPYRNNTLFRNLISHLHSNTTLCIAQDLTSANEHVVAKSVNIWRDEKVDLAKSPAIFLFLA